jgi:hypothetical protein
MSLFDRLLNAERKLQKRVEDLFGAGAASTPLEVRREILDQVEARIVTDRGGRSFPYERILVRLVPRNDADRDVFSTAFLEGGSLEDDIRQIVQDSGAQVPALFEVAIEIGEQVGGAPQETPPTFSVEFVRRAPDPAPARPQPTLVVVKGAAEQQTYPVVGDRLLIGRLAELLDEDGQMSRRNDVAFLDNGDDINSTVGRCHAAIYFAAEKNEFRIVDEMSRYGTRVFREGRSIEVPPGNQRGIRLRPGDEIYIGRACLRFEQ